MAVAECLGCNLVEDERASHIDDALNTVFRSLSSINI
jgi:hypothetical protein